MSEPLKPFPDAWKPLETELRAYFRALPELLAAGEAGRYVVIRGSDVYDTWDSYRDASQFGHRMFDDGRFMAQPVDPQMLQALGRYIAEPAPAVAEVA